MNTKKPTPADIIIRWAKFANYDPNQKQFNLLSANYVYHGAGELVEKLANGYDPSGVISVLYLKKVFTNVIGDIRVRVLDLMENPEGLDDIKEMWDIFQSEGMKEIENGFLSAIDQLFEKTTGRHMLKGKTEESAESDLMLPTLMGAVEGVAEELSGCRIELFQRGGAFTPTLKFEPRIQVFNKMAECLVALQSAPDATYLCFIANNGSADGYFAFMVKNNGGIMSVNERVDETFMGQHACGRNNRWMEEKKTSLFPYSLISGEDFDYKGYAKKLNLNNEELNTFRLGPDTYLPIILAVMMINNKLSTGIADTLQQTYTVSLLPHNLPSLSETALAVINHGSLAKIHQEFSVGFNDKDVLSGTPGRQFTRGCFPEVQLMADLWGEGFQFDPSLLLKETPLLAHKTTAYSEKVEIPPVEFVGNEERLRMEGYRQARQQLADYIRKKMFEAYVEFGGSAGVRKWMEATIQQNRERLLMLAAKAASSKEKLPELGTYRVYTSEQREEAFREHWGYGFGSSFNLNKPSLTKTGQYRGDLICEVNGYTCSIYVQFRPADWRELEAVLGVEVPKILKGWKEDRRSCGNPLLMACDPVADIGTPIEEWEREVAAFYYGYGRGGDKRGLIYEKFPSEQEGWGGLSLTYRVGFSKWGLKAFLKEHPEISTIE